MRSVATKFLLPVAAVTVVLFGLLLYRGYVSARRQTVDLLHQQAALALEFDLAIREYVADEVRPLMEEHVAEDEFIPESMSTSFVARRIFERVREQFPDYIIKFSSDDPRNPANQAGSDELRMIEYFNARPEVDRWTGPIALEGQPYLAHFSARRMSEDCLRCHGQPSDAPASLLARYGATAGFHRPVGEVVALDTIAVPMDRVNAAAFAEVVRQSAVMLGGFVLLLVSIIGLFRLVVARRLRRMAAHFRETAEHDRAVRITPVAVSGRDEISLLGESFNALAGRLNEAQATLEEQVAVRTAALREANEGLKEEIRQRKETEAERRQRLERIGRLHSAIVTIATDNALVTGDLDRALRLVTEVAAEALEIERASVWLLEEDRRRLHCVDRYRRTEGRHESGQRLCATDYPRYFQALEARRAIDAHDALHDLRTREFAERYVRPSGITAILDAPVRVSGELAGVVCLEHVSEPRTWTDDMITFAGELADQVAHALMSGERQAAERRLQIVSDERRELERVINQSPAIAFLWRAEPDWPVEYVSENVRQLGYSPEQLCQGEPAFLQIIHPDDRARLLAEVGQFTAEDRDEFCQEYRVLTADAEVRWVEDRTWARRDEAGAVTHYQGLVLDITDQVRAREALRLNEARLEAMVNLSQKTHASIRELTDFALEQAVRLTGSEVGYLAFVEEGESVIRMHSWSRSAMAQCQIADRQLVYRLEETGLWGEPVRQRRPVIINDYEAPDVPRKGYPGGHVPIRRHLGVPVFDGDQVVALVGVGNKEQAYDEADIRQLTLLLDGMWRIIQRRRTEDELEAERRQLVSMFDGLDEPVYVADPDTHELLYMNAAARKQWGDGIGRTCHEVLQGTDQPCTFCTNDRLFGDNLGTPYVWEFQNSRNDRWYRCVDRAIRWSDGRMVRFEMAIDITDQKRAEERLRHDALHDNLTGLANRSLLRERVNLCLARSRRDPARPFALLFIDLDRFKVINDSLGHEAGDRLLVAVSERLRRCLRATDVVARLGDQTIARVGGDEFVVLLDELQTQDDAARIAQRLLDEITQPLELHDQEIFLSASIGIAPSTAGYESADELLRDADTAMYRAKEAGKARFAVFDAEMHRNAMERLRVENALRRALDQEQFSLRYQPIISVYSNDIVGFEALIRWEHPEKGVIAPSTFIPLAEETGLIVPIGRWALREACRQLQGWRGQYVQAAGLTMSVNVSKRQIIEPHFMDEVKAVLRENGLSASDLAIEITESVVTESPKSVAPILDEIRRSGIELHMDDFGTGESSLSCLHHYPIAVLKIDREFIANMEANGDYSAIVNAIIALAHHMGMRVIAEGVETTQQLNQVIMMNCDYCQGYYFAPPLTAMEVESLLMTDGAQAKSA